jgi:hypothetical protein
VSSDNSALYYASPHWKALRAACLARDQYHCTVDGCEHGGAVADHIEARPDSAEPTPLDVLGNLRTLCRVHDAQVKEQRRNDALSRRNNGRFRVMGCDDDGWPLDPHRR